MAEKSRDLAEVSVFRGKDGHPKPEPEAEAGDQWDEDRQQGNGPGYAKGFGDGDEEFVDQEVSEEKKGLDGKTEQAGNAVGQGVDQSRVIHFLVDSGIGEEGGRVSSETYDEIAPNNQPGVVEKQGGESFGRNLGKCPEYESENDC